MDDYERPGRGRMGLAKRWQEFVVAESLDGLRRPISLYGLMK